MMVFTAAMLLIITFLAVDVVAWHRAHRAVKKPESVAELEQQNLELDQLLHELDPDEFPAPVTMSPLDGDRLDQLREQYRAVPPARKRTLMEQAQVENRTRTLAAVDSMLRSYYAGSPTRGWDVDHDAIALMFEAPVVTIHAVAGAMHQEPERVRCLLSSLGIAWDPVADTVPGRSVYRLCQKQRMGMGHEQSAPRPHTREGTQ